MTKQIRIGAKTHGLLKKLAGIESRSMSAILGRLVRDEVDDLLEGEDLIGDRGDREDFLAWRMERDKVMP